MKKKLVTYQNYTKMHGPKVKKMVTYQNYTKIHGPKNNKKIGYLPQLYKDVQLEKCI